MHTSCSKRAPLLCSHTTKLSSSRWRDIAGRGAGSKRRIADEACLPRDHSDHDDLGSGRCRSRWCFSRRGTRPHGRGSGGGPRRGRAGERRCLPARAAGSVRARGARVKRTVAATSLFASLKPETTRIRLGSKPKLMYKNCIPPKITFSASFRIPPTGGPLWPRTPMTIVSAPAQCSH